MGFWAKLEESIAQSRTASCVWGWTRIPTGCRRATARWGTLCEDIVEQTAEYACVFKPNIAFYEALGQPGWDALRETLAAIPEDMPVLLDAKRNDISSTAAAYARAVFDELGVDAVTINPYLGSDGVEPFLAYEDRGVFLLCKTSNPGAGDLQDWSQYGQPLYRRVAELAGEWAQGQEIGLVIGATYPEAMAEIRAAWPKTWFLVPGVGAQGGDLEAALQAGLRPDGRGLIVNSSRGIIYADDPRQAAQGNPRCHQPRPRPGERVRPLKRRAGPPGAALPAGAGPL
jgi:uridine monophosphate synthetase